MQIKRTYKVIRVLCLKATHTLYKILRYSCICFKKLTTCECFHYFYRPEVCFIFKNLGMSIFKEKVLAIEIWIFFLQSYISRTLVQRMHLRITTIYCLYLLERNSCKISVVLTASNWVNIS